MNLTINRISSLSMLFRRSSMLLVISFFCFNSITVNKLGAQSLEGLLEIAIDRNLELSKLNTDYLAAMERAPQVSQLPDPEAGIGLYPLPVQTRLGAQVFRMSASQMFPWPGTLNAKKDIELAKAKTLQKKEDAKTLDIFYQIKKAYYELYEMEKSQEILEKNVTIYKALERIALSKVASGKVTGADVLRIQLKTTEFEQNIRIIETRKAKPIANINQWLNRDENIVVEIVDSLGFAQIIYDRDALFEEIEANHPVLEMIALQQEVSQQEMASNRLNGKPQMGGGIDYIFVKERSDADPSHNGRDILQLKASIKIPINRKKYKAKNREEQLRIEALEDEKKDVFSKYKATISNIWTDYEMAQLQVQLYTKQAEITKAAIQILQTTYSTQGLNFDDLLALENELIAYELKMLNTIVLSHVLKSRIERFIPNNTLR